MGSKTSVNLALIGILLVMAMTLVPRLLEYRYDHNVEVSVRRSFSISNFYPQNLNLSEEAIIQRTSICSSYMKFLATEFPKKPNENENAFPLAFAISAHHQVGILELFLASSFHPLDSYCIHVDVKAEEEVKTAISQLVKCYQSNYPEASIFVVEDPIPVFWGHFSVIEADLKCLRLLRAKNERWKVVINPAATELPLKPMTEIRRYLKAIPDGIVDSFPVPEGNKYRFTNTFELQRYGEGKFDKHEVMTNKTKILPPRNITMRKGSKNVALPRKLVDFTLDAPFSQDFLEWIKDTSIPDEHFYSTLITMFHNRTQDLETDFTYGGCVRLSWWGDSQCRGENIRSICNFGIEDLPRLHQNHDCLFANKFNLEVDPIAPISHTLFIMDLRPMDDDQMVQKSQKEGHL